MGSGTLGPDNVELPRYDPTRELLESYQSRVRRQSAVLASIQEPVPDGALELALQLSSMEAELYERAYDDREKQIRMLKREFALLSTLDEPTPLDVAKLKSLVLLLRERDVDMVALEEQVRSDPRDVAPTPLTRVSRSGFEGRTNRTLDYRLDGQGVPTPVRPLPEPRGLVSQLAWDPLQGVTPVPQSQDRLNDQEYQRMQDQLREAQLEIAAQRAAAAIPASPQLESIMEKQTQILEAALAAPRG